MRTTILLSLAVTLFACGDEPTDPCVGGLCTRADAGPPDAGSDAGPHTDAAIDGGPARDAGPSADAGPVVDGGPVADGGPPTCGPDPCRGGSSAGGSSLDVDYFDTCVQPILDRGCSSLACHGSRDASRTSFHIYALGRDRIDSAADAPARELLAQLAACGGDPSVRTPPQQCLADVSCECGGRGLTPLERSHNFESSRSVGFDASGRAELLDRPSYGDTDHGNWFFWSPGDPDHETIRLWLSGAGLAPACP